MWVGEITHVGLQQIEMMWWHCTDGERWNDCIPISELNHFVDSYKFDSGCIAKATTFQWHSKPRRQLQLLKKEKIDKEYVGAVIVVNKSNKQIRKADHLLYTANLIACLSAPK